MSVGSAHDETGVLLREAHWLVLAHDAGGRWRLEAPRGAARLLGRRVRVVGTRAAFDLLEVTRIEAL